MARISIGSVAPVVVDTISRSRFLRIFFPSCMIINMRISAMRAEKDEDDFQSML